MMREQSFDMRKSLSREVRKLIEHEIDKDLSRSDLREIDSYIAGKRSAVP